MTRVMCTTTARHAVLGLMLAGLTTSSITNTNAGDLYAPSYRSYPYAAPAYERTLDYDRYYGAAPSVHPQVEAGDGICRIFHERRVDPYGLETIHRIRMCDEGPVYRSPNGAVPPGYGYKARPYYERSGYDPYPRPAIGVPIR